MSLEANSQMPLYLEQVKKAGICLIALIKRHCFIISESTFDIIYYVFIIF